MKRRFETTAIHAGCEPEQVTGAIIPPIFQTSTYVQPAPAEHKGYEYSRTGNPTRTALETSLCALEGGVRGLAFASGMAAIDTVLKLLESGDHIVAGDDLYGGTYRLFKTVFEPFGLRFTFVDTTDPHQVAEAIEERTRFLWIETPSNPLLKITDVKRMARIAAEAGCRLVVDNTFASPVLQRPLELGAHLVVHSTTKYLGGHSDVVGGAVVTRSEEEGDRLAHIQNSAGAVPGPFDSFLVHRGIKTLAVRMDRHCENARRVATFLSDHPKVERVHYPGLPDHPGHEVAAEQMADFGGMVACELAASVEEAKTVTTKTRVFALAESLGGVESLIEHPASMTHAAVPREERLKAGLADGLIRLSIGIEHADDLIDDLEQVLDSLS